MIQLRDRQHFTFESCAADVRPGDAGGERLEGDVTTEACVAGAVDLAHPAHPDERDDFVRTDQIARPETHAQWRLWPRHVPWPSAM